MSVTQKDSAQTFGLATEKIGSAGENELISVRSGIVEMNKALVILDRTKNSENLNFDKPAYATSTATRVAACKALRHYGDLLVHLASDDRDLSIRKSALNFMDNINDALDSKLTPTQNSILAKIVTGTGYSWTEASKAEVLRNFTAAYEPVVDQLADLLAADFALDDSANGYLKAYQLAAKQLLNAAVFIIDGGDEYYIDERAQAVESYYMAQTALVRSNEIGTSMSAGIVELKKANHVMVKNIQEHGYDVEDFKELGKQIQKVNNMQKVLN